MSIMAKIQEELKAPKNQYNKFGKYPYRSCEDIIEAVKPLLHGSSLYLTITDEIIAVGDRIYVKATATVHGDDVSMSTSAYAREPETQKGMNDAQITGSASSYARKYALNGLFAIDDTKDADATNKHGKEPTNSAKPQKQEDDGAQSPLPKILAKINSYDDVDAFQEYLDQHWTAVEYALKDFTGDIKKAKKAMTDKLASLAGNVMEEK